MSRKSFGTIRKTSSGKFSARYSHAGHKITLGTYITEQDARIALDTEKIKIYRGEWVSPDEQARLDAEAEAASAAAAIEEAKKQVTVRELAHDYIEKKRKRDGSALSDRTKNEYRRYLDDRLAIFADRYIADLTSEEVEHWYFDQIQDGAITSVAHHFTFLKGVCIRAIYKKIIAENPCISEDLIGAGNARTGIEVIPPTDDEVDKLVELMPAELRHCVLLGASAGLRWGEIAPLTPEDLRIATNADGVVESVTVVVTRAEIKVKGVRSIKKPKSKAGIREATFYGADARAVAEHAKTVAPGERLTRLQYEGVRYHWQKAREEIDRHDLRFHALRHYAGTRFTQAGGTSREVMAFLGHSTFEASFRYQHAAQERVRAVARIAARRA